MLAWESGLTFSLYFRILTFVNEMGILTLHFSHANQSISSNKQFKFFFFFNIVVAISGNQDQNSGCSD